MRIKSFYNFYVLVFLSLHTRRRKLNLQKFCLNVGGGQRTNWIWIFYQHFYKVIPIQFFCSIYVFPKTKTFCRFSKKFSCLYDKLESWSRQYSVSGIPSHKVDRGIIFDPSSGQTSTEICFIVLLCMDKNVFSFNFRK